MDLKTLLTADYLDIIFDKRNKEYGGYELRKHYNNRLGKASGFLLLGVAACCSLSFISSKPGTERIANTVAVSPKIIDMQPQPPKPQPVVQPATPPPPAKQVKTITVTPPVIEPDDQVVDKQLTPTKDLHNAQVGATTTDGDDSPDISLTVAKKGGTGTSVVTDPPPVLPVTWVQQMPQFAGSMSDYINSHLHYPDAARTAGIEGQVLIRFVVNEDGSISETTVARGIGGGCDEEALRMVRSMPKWKPGRQNGLAVKVYFTLPIKFVLQ